MGSGETAPTMVKAHRAIFDRIGSESVVGAVMLDTPFGFQENADELATRAIAYFDESVGRPLRVVSFRRAATTDAMSVDRVRLQLEQADLVFAGPGSPTYALAQWAASPIPTVLAEKLRTGGAVVFASAAALTLGIATVPVYEIYKAGVDPAWRDGLDLTSALGLSIAVIPHYDNAEGGTHDTRFCYLGERRLRLLETQLPGDAFVLGVDEHTAAIFDLDEGNMTVMGRGVVTVRADGRSSIIESGMVTSIAALAEMATQLGRGGSEPIVTTSIAAPEPEEIAGGGSGRSPLLEAIAAHQAAFGAALVARDATTAVGALLALEEELHLWSADTLQSDEMDQGRAALRGMIIRLGDAAVGGLVDPREVAAPWVETLLELRSSARTGGRWDDADDIRDRLIGLGIEVRDTPAGTAWDRS